MLTDIIKIGSGIGFFLRGSEDYMTLVGAGSVPKSLPYFRPRYRAPSKLRYFDYSKVKIFPLGFRDYGSSFDPKGPYKRSLVERAVFCLLYTENEEPVLGYLVTKKIETALFNSLGANLAFGYTPYLQGIYQDHKKAEDDAAEVLKTLFSGTSIARQGSLSISKPENETLYDIDRQLGVGFQWFESFAKEKETSSSYQILLMFNQQKSSLDYLQYAALITFARLFCIREYRVDFTPLIKPIEKETTLMEVLHSIKETNLQEWIVNLIPELLLHESASIRSLAAHHVQTKP